MARCTFKIVISIETGEVLERVSCEWNGRWALCKGSNSQQEMQNANKLSQQELQMLQTQLGMVNPSLKAMIQNGGLSPQVQAAMTSLVQNQLPATYNTLEGQLQNRLTQAGVTGGQMAGGGDIARTFGQLGATEAQQQQQGLSDIQLAKQQNLMQSLGLALSPVSTFNQGAVGALGAGVNAAGNADQAQTGFWGSLFGALGGLGAPLIGKMPSFGSSAPSGGGGGGGDGGAYY